MNKETLKALKKAIEKWEKIVAEKGKDRGSRNCALCWLFLKNECEGCPVHAKTGRRSCRGTPYAEWVRHHAEDHFSVFSKACVIECSKCKELAQKELEFLRSLLPENEEKQRNMRAYKVTVHDSIDDRTCCYVVVAKNKQKVKELFQKEYGKVTDIENIELISKEVLISEE